MKCKLLLIALAMLPVVVFATNLEDLRIMSPRQTTPNAAELMKYIDQQVDLCYGQVKVEIPLFEIECGDIKLPITLVYNCNGAKPGDDNDRLAYGWYIDAEPVLTRKVNHLQDESAYYSGIPVKTELTPEYIHSLISNGFSREEYPDTFYYKIPGKSGKFYFNHGDYYPNGTPYGQVPEIVTVPYEPIKIVNNNRVANFDITDENGTIYKFGHKACARMITGSAMIPTDWKISEIISANGTDVVSFEYDTDYVRTFYNNVDDMIVLNTWQYAGLPGQDFLGTIRMDYPFLWDYRSQEGRKYTNLELKSSPPNGPQQWGPRNTILNERYIEFPPYISGGWETQEWPLRRIRTSTQLITFHTSDNIHISSISVKDIKTGEAVREIRFATSKYTSTKSRVETNRRYLRSVEIMGSDLTKVEKYDFDYYTYMTPGNLDKNFDHWGYCNGTELDPTDMAVPKMDVLANHRGWRIAVTVGNADKTPSLEHTRHGVLNSITYPTGRVSTFEHELNEYERWGEHFTAGGLRVSRIEEYDPVSKDRLVRTFKYGKNENGKGDARFHITDKSYTYEYQYIYTNRFIEENKTGYVNSLVYAYTATPIPVAMFPNGSPVYYEYVTEYRDGGKKGKIDYVFSRHQESLDHKEGTTIVLDSDMDWDGGKLLTKTEYECRTDNGQEVLVPVIKESFTYGGGNGKVIPYGVPYIAGYSRNKGMVPTLEAVRLFNAVQVYRWRMVSGWSKLTRKTIEYFTYGIPSYTVTERYGYNTKGVNALVAIQSNSGEETSVKTYFPGDDLPYPVESTEAITQMEEKHMYATPLIREYRKNDTKWSEVLTYSNKKGTGKPVITKYLHGKNGQFKERSEIKQYDKYANPRHIIHDRVNESCYIWGYGGRYLIAIIENCSWNQLLTKVNTTLLNRVADAYTPSVADLDAIEKLRGELPDSFISTFTYDVHKGLVSETDPAGVKTSYSYDGFGRMNRIFDTDGNSLEEYRYKYSR